jgi:hypothetical protein
MICKRVVHEHGSDMHDAVAVGDDVSAFCKEEAGVCKTDDENDKSRSLIQDVLSKTGQKRRRKKRKAPAADTTGPKDDL